MNDENLRHGNPPTQFHPGRGNGRGAVENGEKSGEARRKKRTMKQAAKMLLDLPVSNPAIAARLSDFGISEEDLTNQMVVLVAMINQATKGNVRAAAFLRDTAGYDPDAEIKRKEQKLKQDQFNFLKEQKAREEAGGVYITGDDPITAALKEAQDANQRETEDDSAIPLHDL